jgi:hypothetical protein
VASEARAECYAYQTLASVAGDLGVSGPEARRLARFAWNRLYDPRDSEYGSPHCHDGGAFDLHPTRPVWP